MKALYGDKVRNDSGIEQAIKEITKEALSTPQIARLRQQISKRIEEVRRKAESSDRYRKIVQCAKKRRESLKPAADKLIDALRVNVDIFLENARKLTRERDQGVKED